MSEMSWLRKEMERMLQLYPTGISSTEMARRAQADPDTVRSVIGRMKSQCQIRSIKSGRHTLYVWVDGNKKPSMANPNQINRMAGDYTPDRDNPPARRRPGCDQHEQCGSRIGNVLYFRDKTIAYL